MGLLPPIGGEEVVLDCAVSYSADRDDVCLGGIHSRGDLGVVWRLSNRERADRGGQYVCRVSLHDDLYRLSGAMVARLFCFGVGFDFGLPDIP